MSLYHKKTEKSNAIVNIIGLATLLLLVLLLFLSKPMTFLISGQSNVTVQTNNQFKPKELWNLNGFLPPVRVSQYHFQEPIFNVDEWTPLEQAHTFSLFAGYFGIYFADLTARSAVRIIASGNGSSLISCWLKKGFCRENWLDKYSEKTIDGIVWWQGESDALSGIEPLCHRLAVSNYCSLKFRADIYQASLEELIKSFRIDFGNEKLPIVIIALQGYYETENTESEKFKEIRKRQLLVAANDLNIEIVNAKEYVEDDLHPQEYYDEIALDAAKKMKMLLNN